MTTGRINQVAFLCDTGDAPKDRTTGSDEIRGVHGRLSCLATEATIERGARPGLGVLHPQARATVVTHGLNERVEAAITSSAMGSPPFHTCWTGDDNL